MPQLSSSQIRELLKSPENQRNICILAHVDHGKTSLSDNLISSNGIISVRQSGKLRFLDFRHDEQERLITMKSTAIALAFHDGGKDYMINLIDSPGHVDFSGEVSAAVRVSDGALVVVDAVEGVCVQTRTVLRQAWDEYLTPILIINKMDRLFGELQLTPGEIYKRMRDLIEQVNAIVGTFAAEEELKLHEGTWTAGSQEQYKKMLEEKEQKFLFSPAKDNVIFASAIDHWGFSLKEFVAFYSAKFGMNPKVLEQTLWGEFYFDARAKKLYKKPQDNISDPMFAQLIIKPIHELYSAAEANDTAHLVEMFARLDIKLGKSSDVLGRGLEQWLPLPRCVLSHVVSIIPTPQAAQRLKADRLAGIEAGDHTKDRQDDGTEKLRRLIEEGDPEGETLAYVAKVFPYEKSLLPKAVDDGPLHISFPKKRERKPLSRPSVVPKPDDGLASEKSLYELSGESKSKEASSPSQPSVPKSMFDLETTSATPSQPSVPKSMFDLETAPSAPSAEAPATEPTIPITHLNDDPTSPRAYICVVRVYSGRVKEGDVLYLRPGGEDKVEQITVRKVYLMMGNGMSVIGPEGGCGILGIIWSGRVSKTGTLSSSPALPALRRCAAPPPQPIIRVAVDTVDPQQRPRLARGLALLAATDPACQCLLMGSGEYVILAAGEVHFERCLTDLRELFVDVPIVTSSPLVPFRETVVADHERELAPPAGLATLPPQCPGGVRVWSPAPLGGYWVGVRALPLPGGVRLMDLKWSEDKTQQRETIRVLDDAFGAEKGWQGLAGHAACIVGSGNVLVAGADPDGVLETLRERCDGVRERPADALRVLGTSVEGGFRLAVRAGPLCGEAMAAVTVVVDLVRASEDGERGLSIQNAGQTTSTARELITSAIAELPLRLVEPLFACEIHVSSEYVGAVYKVLSRRKATVQSEDVLDANSMFIVRAMLPVAESFGFSEDLRKCTSGHAVPQLEFSHFEVLDEDPYWEPTTEEELEFYGTKGDQATNRARRYVDDERKRKGLPLLKKLVEEPEKQRTLSKKK